MRSCCYYASWSSHVRASVCMCVSFGVQVVCYSIHCRSLHHVDYSGIMTNHVDLVSDLQDISELIDVQVAAGLSHDDMSTQRFAAWAERLSKHVKMSTKGKIEVTKAINSGPWAASQSLQCPVAGHHRR